MPNWAYTKYYIRSADDSAEQIYNRMKRLQDMPQPLKPNGFGTAWLGNLVEDFGVDFNTVQCGGSWQDLTYDNGILSFSTETAWYRCTEVEDLLMERYPEIEIHFMCEEGGMAIYEKNSDEFFPEDYIIDIPDDDSYYCMEDEAITIISNFFGVDFNCIQDALTMVNELNSNDDDNQIYVHKFDLVD